MPRELSADGKDQLALALVLLKDFKVQGLVFSDPQYLESFLMVVELAEYIGVKAEFEAMLSKIPPMRIEPKP